MTRYDTGTDQVLVTVSNGVAEITLNRPERRNAFGVTLITALGQALADMEADDDVRVILLTGAGGAFCAGGDVGSMGARNSGDGPTVDTAIRQLQIRQENVSLRIFDMTKPVIAALPGAAAGAGMSIALSCDLRIASDTAVLVPAFGAIGLSGDFGGSWFLSRLIGPGRAKEIYFTGRRVAAKEAQALGIFNHVVPADDLMDTARTMAAQMAQAAPLALRYMKENHNRAMVADLKSTLSLEADRMVRLMQTEDHKGAAKAFLAKEKSTFSGR